MIAAAFIIGAEATDVPDNVTLLGPDDVLTEETVSILGKAMPHEVAQRIEEVDTTAPMWGLGRIALPGKPVDPFPAHLRAEPGALFRQSIIKRRPA